LGAHPSTGEDTGTAKLRYATSPATNTKGELGHTCRVPWALFVPFAFLHIYVHTAAFSLLVQRCSTCWFLTCASLNTSGRGHMGSPKFLVLIWGLARPFPSPQMHHEKWAHPHNPTVHVADFSHHWFCVWGGVNVGLHAIAPSERKHYGIVFPHLSSCGACLRCKRQEGFIPFSSPCFRLLVADASHY